MLRYAIPMAALLAIIAYQRPSWLHDVQATAEKAGHQLGLAALLGGHGPIAGRALAAEPDRAAALGKLDRVATARDAAVSAPKDPAARERVQELLRSAAATMAGSEAMGELRALQDARARLAGLREQAAQQRLSGGDTAALDGEIAGAGAEVARLTDAFTDRLEAVGVRISRDAAQNLAVAVNGDDTVALLGAYANVAKLEAELRQAVAQSADNEAVVRRYYGVHAALLAVLETIQADCVARIDAAYLPRLDAIGQEIATLRQDAQSRLRSVRDPDLKASLEANLRTQDMTAKAADLYRGYLQDQRASLAAALDRTRAARGVADNTVRTASLALDLAAMVRNTDRDFSAVMAVRPPVIVPFEGEALRREFEGLSRRLGQTPAS